MPAEPRWSAAELRCAASLVDERKVRAVRMGGIDLTFQQDTKPLITGTRVWPGSTHFAEYIERNPRKALRGLCGRGVHLPESRVIELGAGCCGIGGCSLALHGAQSVVLTDGEPDAIAMLQANVNSNAALLPPTVTCAMFLWGEDPAEAGLAPPYDIIIGCDIINPDLLNTINPDPSRAEKLVVSLKALSHASTVFIFAMEERPHADIARFERMLSAAGFEMSHVVRRVRPSTMSRPWLCCAAAACNGSTVVAGEGGEPPPLSLAALEEQSPVTIVRCRLR